MAPQWDMAQPGGVFKLHARGGPLLFLGIVRSLTMYNEEERHSLKCKLLHKKAFPAFH